MAVVSRILNVLVILAAVGALVIGMKLAEHRQAARDRADAYATVIKSTADALDINSGTGVGGEVTKLAWNDWEADNAGTKASAEKITAQAKGVIAQRDGLADRIVKIGKSVGAEVDANKLKTTAGYDTDIAIVDARIAAINDRDAAIAEEIAKISETIGQPVDAAALLALGEDNAYDGAALKSVTDHMDNIKRMHVMHVATLKRIVDAAGPDLGFSEEEYEKADHKKVEILITNLGTLRAAMEENKGLKQDKARLTADLKTKTTELDDLRVKFATHMEEEHDPDKPVIVKPGEFIGPLSGEIVSVNYELNYVVINFGSDKTLAETTTLAVARDREFICNVVVTEVFPKFAVCDIVPDKRGGTVIPGDTVIRLPAE